jgi:hypothetical protein
LGQATILFWNVLKKIQGGREVNVGWCKKNLILKTPPEKFL